MGRKQDMEHGTIAHSLRQVPKALAAIAVTAALFLLIAFGFDASAVRVFLGITPPLDVPYVGTRSTMVDAMLDMADVGPSDYVIDLGTGDGRILIAAARDRGAAGVGVDLDPALIDDANAEAENLGLSDRIVFREQDLFDTPLNDADVVTMFLLPSVNMRLRPRLLSELTPGSRVVSNRFDMGDWRPDAVRRISGYNSYLWVIPAQVGGTWELTFGEESIALELNQEFQDVEGTAIIAGEVQEIGAILRGDRLRLEIEVDEEIRIFEGILRGDSLVSAKDSDLLAVRIGAPE